MLYFPLPRFFHLPRAMVNLFVPIIFLGLSLGRAGAVPPKDTLLPRSVVSASTTPVAIMDSDYVLAPDDVLDISVHGHEELRAAVAILPDGTFNYQGAGTVHAAGLTISALTHVLEKGLVDLVNQPMVTVSVRESHVRKISILGGAVRGPGQYPYKPGMRLLEALAACGFLTEVPELIQGTLVTDEGKTSQPLDLVGLMTGKDVALNVPLKPGDILLMLPRNPTTAQVQVVGEVARPGLYTVPAEGDPVQAVLTLAGGPTGRAALTRAQVMHAGKAKTIDLHPLLQNAEAPAGQVRLFAGDVLNVPTDNAKIAVMGEVRAPSIYYIPDGENLSLTSALALAGGANDAGDKKKVQIVRHDKSDKPFVINVNVESVLRGEDVANANLQPGDILFVPTRHRPFNALEALGVIASTSNAYSVLKRGY